MFLRRDAAVIALIASAATCVVSAGGNSTAENQCVAVVDIARVLKGNAQFAASTKELLRREKELRARSRPADNTELELLAKEGEELVATTLVRIESTVRALAVRRGIRLVVRIDSPADDACKRRAKDCAVIYASKEIDVTDEVIRMMNSN